MVEYERRAPGLAAQPGEHALDPVSFLSEALLFAAELESLHVSLRELLFPPLPGVWLRLSGIARRDMSSFCLLK